MRAGGCAADGAAVFSVLKKAQPPFNDLGVHLSEMNRAELAGGFLTMAGDYQRSSQFLRSAVEDDQIRLSYGAVPDNCLSQGVELALKALLIAVDKQFEPHTGGHDLSKLYARIEDHPESLEAESRMFQTLAAVPPYGLTLQEAAEQLSGKATSPSLDVSAINSAKDLMKWYGLHHSYRGGLFRYHVSRSELNRPFVWVLDAAGNAAHVDLRSLAMEHWLAAFLTIIEPKVRSLRGSDFDGLSK
ncbi:hypothetical protein [Jannaschia helgolandensis]|uniref:HEPN domain-containing protein n=1 Tax=Jannaschia helgolandensis TaxID=188906 RepID=A0A1H7NNA4_9RHOB|nr:hypothetical protein [Jannaschia helgolandensis]SEL25033.1 hypothetical protein SAMN04488526_2258 [Jannaschia helgolandensis]